MSSPRRSASMRAWGACLGILTVVLPNHGQEVSITASRQDAAIPRAYVGADIPKGLGVYMVMGCNRGPADAVVYVDRIIHEVSEVAAVQDGAAVLYAAREHKGSGWKVAAYRIGGIAAMAAGGFASAGASTVLGQVAGGVGGAAGISTLLKGRAAELARLDVPGNWWTPDPTRVAALKPGQCMAPMLVALSGNPGERLERSLKPLIAEAVIKEHAEKLNKAVVTHPQVDEAAERAAQVAAWVRERSAMIGAAQ